MDIAGQLAEPAGELTPCRRPLLGARRPWVRRAGRLEPCAHLVQGLCGRRVRHVQAVLFPEVPVDTPVRPHVGLGAGRPRPLRMSTSSLRRMSRGIFRGLPGILRGGAAPRPPLCMTISQFLTACAWQTSAPISLNDRPFLRWYAAMYFLQVFASFSSLARRASSSTLVSGIKPSPVGIDPPRPMPALPPLRYDHRGGWPLTPLSVLADYRRCPVRS